MTPIKRNARVLRNLKIHSVDSVDRGAGEGVRVLLTKRDNSTATFETQEHKSMDTIAKLQEDIGKRTTDTIESVAEKIQKRTGCTWNEAKAQAAFDPAVTEIHRREQTAKFGKSYSATDDHRRSPDPVRVDEPAAVLEKLTDAHLAKNPHLTRAAAMSAMALSPQFTQAHVADKARRGIA